MKETRTCEHARMLEFSTVREDNVKQDNDATKMLGMKKKKRVTDDEASGCAVVGPPGCITALAAAVDAAAA